MARLQVADGIAQSELSSARRASPPYPKVPPSHKVRCSSYIRQLEDQVKNLSSLLNSQNEAQPRGGHSPPAQEPSASASIIGNNFSPAPPEDPALSGIRGRLAEQRSGEKDASLTPPGTSRSLAGEREVSGINRHTRNVEFYGSSSSVALLSHIQRTGRQDELGSDATSAAALVTSLHNPSFHSPEPHGGGQPCGQGQSPQHFSHCRSFLHNYFSAIHYIHPIIDKQRFLERCEALWSGAERADRPSSFLALYYSVLSLGALTGVRDDEPIEGIGNLQWSRRFFDMARSLSNQLGMVTDLDMVQCYFLMSKVCQNELSPHRRCSPRAVSLISMVEVLTRRPSVIHVRRSRCADGARYGHQPRARVQFQRRPGAAESRMQDVVVSAWSIHRGLILHAADTLHRGLYSLET